MEKIKMRTPLVEMDGDEMTRILWQDIKDILLTPYIDLKTEYYDFSGKKFGTFIIISYFCGVFLLLTT